MERFLYYAVIEEHTLGYMFHNTTGATIFGILHGSILRGSPYDWTRGWLSIGMCNIVRLATEKDFDDYRLCLPPDFKQYNQSR